MKKLTNMVNFFLAIIIIGGITMAIVGSILSAEQQVKKEKLYEQRYLELKQEIAEIKAKLVK